MIGIHGDTHAGQLRMLAVGLAGGRAVWRSVGLGVGLGVTLAASAAIAQPEAMRLAAERADDLESRAVAIASIDPRIEGDDFADLMPLKDAIGDARVVWLGEQSHGEGAAFLAKGRLVKFLHQEMGFDVLVWEAGLAMGPLVDEAMRDPARSAAEAANEGIFPIWSAAMQVGPLLDYVKATQQTDRRIISAGMDAQLTGAQGIRAMIDHVEHLFAPIGGPPAGAVAFGEASQAFWEAAGPDTGRLAIEQLSAAVAAIEAAAAEIDANHEPWRREFVERCLGDAASFIRTRVAYLEADGNMMNMDRDLLNDRDRRMGDNLVFLTNEVYPDRKMIVWAATFHGIYDLPAIRYDKAPGMYDTMFAAGMTAHRELDDDLYHVAFLALGGEVGSVYMQQPRRIGARPEGSVERTLDRIEDPFLFVDLRGLPGDHWLRGPTVMAPLGNEPMTAAWPEQFDGFVSIEAEFPASRERLAPEGYALTVGE
ncbi:MAG: erythromycin esterase family protein [Planctomycetota bacterium]